MIKRNIVHIEIPTSNAKESAEFYEKLFGWHMEHVEKMDYTMFDPHEGPGGGFTQVDENTKPGDVVIYINSDDIEADLNWCGRNGSPTKVNRIQAVVLSGGEYREFPPTEQGAADLATRLAGYSPGTTHWIALPFLKTATATRSARQLSLKRPKGGIVPNCGRSDRSRC